MTASYSVTATESTKDGLQPIARVAAIIFVVGISVAIMLNRERIEGLAMYGYPAVFVVSLLGNASVILPAPSYVIVFAAGTALNPLGVGIVAALGAALGEMSGYLAGLSSQGIFEDRIIYRKIKGWMDKSGTLVIFLLGAIPNFFFDVGGMIAGAVGMPLWRFLLAGWLGKSIRLAIVAWAGSAVL